jgi:hypothetical protein
MENECKNEKNSLIKLLRCYKLVLHKIVAETNIDFSSHEEYLTLKRLYEDTEKKLLDSDYFHCLLGRSFEELSKVDLNELYELEEEIEEVEEMEEIEE